MAQDDIFEEEVAVSSDNPTSEFDALMEEASTLEGVPEGAYVTLRHESSAPMFVPLDDGELTITILEALRRRGLTFSRVNAYVDSVERQLDYPLSAGAVAMIVGDVKGG